MIKTLDSKTIALISAGEVIESPADVLKELIENSIDAGAKSVSVTIKNSGLDLIEVKDDGLGIPRQELPLAIERHATSKLEKLDDLYNLDTFGFRGEALASINAISKLVIFSSDNDLGFGYVLEDNKVSKSQLSKGTIVSVNNLFYNVPVRKKFLKSNASEFSRLYTTFLEFVLLNPDIRFQFVSEKKNEVYAKTTREGRYVQVFGKDILFKTIELNITNQFFSLKGIVCKPTNYFYFPSNFLYINRRPVYSQQISKAVADCYKDYLMIQQKPFFVLFFEIDKKAIDINVHPKKRTVKLQNEFVLLVNLKEELKAVLFKDDKKELLQQPITSYIDTQKEIKPLVKQEISYPAREDKTTSPFQDSLYSVTQPVAYGLKLGRHKIKAVLGQILNTYIVCESEDGLLLIDQHAAEERINLEKNREEYLGYVKTQKLITPQVLANRNPETADFILKNKNTFQQLGFTIEKSGDALVLTTIPEFLERYFNIDFFYEVLKAIEQSPKDSITKLKDKILKLKSCKESVKANEQLSFSKIFSIIKKLDECKDKDVCAHGRPTTIVLNKKDLEKMFKRVV